MKPLTLACFGRAGAPADTAGPSALSQALKIWLKTAGSDLLAVAGIASKVVMGFFSAFRQG